MDLFEVLAQFGIQPRTVALRPLLGTSGYGEPVYGSSVDVDAVVEQKRRLVRSATGDEVVAETTLYVRSIVSAPDGSKVTLPDGQVTTVITVSRFDDHTQVELPAHLQIACA